MLFLCREVFNTMKHLIIIAIMIGACNNAPVATDQSVADTSNTTNSSHDNHHDMPAADLSVEKGQSVYFPNLTDGQEITLPYVVEFGVKGMEVEPAQMPSKGKGHHHLLIDQGAVTAGEMVPMGQEQNGYYHFGKGQTKDTLSLAKYPMLKKGTHKLRLQFANGLHQSYVPAMRTEVMITIK